jgi:hypothetical protein
MCVDRKAAGQSTKLIIYELFFRLYESVMCVDRKGIVTVQDHLQFWKNWISDPVAIQLHNNKVLLLCSGTTRKHVSRSPGNLAVAPGA